MVEYEWRNCQARKVAAFEKLQITSNGCQKYTNNTWCELYTYCVSTSVVDWGDKGNVEFYWSWTVITLKNRHWKQRNRKFLLISIIQWRKQRTTQMRRKSYKRSVTNVVLNTYSIFELWHIQEQGNLINRIQYTKRNKFLVKKKNAQRRDHWNRHMRELLSSYNAKKKNRHIIIRTIFNTYVHIEYEWRLRPTKGNCTFPIWILHVVNEIEWKCQLLTVCIRLTEASQWKNPKYSLTLPLRNRYKY